MRPRQFTDEDMLAVARRCFLDHGPSVSTDVIAEELGVSSAALFRRAGSKRELLIRALAPKGGIPPFVRLLEQGPDDRPAREQLLQVITSIDAFFESMTPLLSLVHAAKLEPSMVFRHFDEPPPVKAQRALAAWLTRMHERGHLVVLQPQSTALTILGAVQSRHFFKMACGVQLAGPEHASVVADTLWRGLAPDSEQR